MRESENSNLIRSVYFSKEFEEFICTLDKRTKDKFSQTIEVIQSIYVLNAKFVKKLVGSDLYEMRVSVGSNEYRTILFAIDNDNIILSTKIVLLNAFLKKSNKDYEKQIKKAQTILNNLEL